MDERVIRMGFEDAEEIGNLLHFQPHQVERLRERVEIRPLWGLNPLPPAVVA